MQEIEVKALLDEKDVVAFRGALAARGFTSVSEVEKQLNHYFKGNSKNVSVRTRWSSLIGTSLFVKVGADPVNGTDRHEVEIKMGDEDIETLDQWVINSGYEVETKWSRTRETYKRNDITITLDKNSGYGYLIEIEQMSEDADTALVVIRAYLKELGLTELPNEQLTKMYEYYVTNWQDYYGTEKTFVI